MTHVDFNILALIINTTPVSLITWSLLIYKYLLYFSHHIQQFFMDNFYYFKTAEKRERRIRIGNLADDYNQLKNERQAEVINHNKFSKLSSGLLHYS